MQMEFGHFASHGNGIFVDSWGAGPFIITVAGKKYRFEDSDRWGPHLVNKHGDLLKHDVPSEKSAFWWSWRLWKDQGRKVAADGETCDFVYRDPKPTTYSGSGRNRFIVESGDEEGGYMEVPCKHVPMQAAIDSSVHCIQCGQHLGEAS
jgi:hypothetical protein